MIDNLNINLNNILYNPFSGIITYDINNDQRPLITRDIEPNISNDMQGVIFVTTTRCNLNCDYCYSHSYKKADLQIKKACFFLDNSISNGKKNIIVNFFGGEPTLRLNFMKAIINHLSNKSNLTVYYRINTNGLFNEEVLNFLIKNKFKVILSSDGRPGKDGNLRGKKNISQIIEKNIKKLADANVTLRIRCTISKNNIHNLHNAIDYWQGLGVEFVHFEAVNPFGVQLKGKEFVPNAKEYVNIMKSLVMAAENRKLWITSSPFSNLLSPTKSFCTTCSGNYVVLTPDGKITSCLRVQMDNENLREFIVGTVSNDGIYYNDKNLNKLRNISVDRSDYCSKCSIRYLCGGGCPMRNFLHTGNVLLPDNWECYVKKELIIWAIKHIGEYINGTRFPSLLGQHVFEKRVFAEPTIGESQLNIKPISLSRPKEIMKKKSETEKAYFVYSLVGTTKDEFLSLSRLSRCECF